MIARFIALFERAETGPAIAAGALAGDSASRILPWATALMAFLAALALAAALAVGDAAARWSDGFGGGLTIQLGAQPTEGPDTLPRVLTMLRATPGIETVTVTPPAEIDRLLAPWLGGLVDLAGLPKPRFLDATLVSGARLDPVILEERLRVADSEVKVDDHEIWANRLAEYARAVARTAMIAAVLIGLISAAGIAAVAAARMAIHADAIRLMRLLGATDQWVSGLIARASLRQGFIGGLVGTILAAIAIFLVERAAAGAEGLMPTPRLLWQHWAVLALLPMTAGCVAVLAARLAALAWLRRR
ncbi:MAG: cell division protein FtsX [Alphaproteobacteria bacterium]